MGFELAWVCEELWVWFDGLCAWHVRVVGPAFIICLDDSGICLTLPMGVEMELVEPH